MNIDFKLFELVTKYNIFKHQPELNNIYAKLCIKVCLNELFDSISEDKVIALRTLSTYTDKVYKLLSDKNKNKIKYIIDRKENEVVHKKITIRPEDVNKNNVDVIILTSWHIRSEFKTEAVKLSSEGIMCIDVYDYVAQRGFSCANIYLQEEEPEKYLHITHLDISSNMYFYKNGTDLSSKKYYLELIIAQLVEIKDFVSVEKYIREYILCDFDTENRYLSFLSELNELISSIEEVAKSRKQEDVIINWIDNLNAGEVYNSSFMEDFKNKTYVFENAYTVTPWTRFTHITVMTGLLPITDNTFMPIKFTNENSEVINCVNKAGYSYKYIAGPGNYAHMYYPENLPYYPVGFDNIVMGDKNISECSTRIQWTALRERLLCEKPVCYIVHNLSESHSPYLYPEMTPFLGERIENKKPAMEYIFDRVKWYTRFYGENVHQVYMTDHGDFILNSRSYEKERTNTALIIKSKKIKPKIEKRLFSIKNFSKIIHFLIDDKEVVWDSIFSDYIIYENPDYARVSGVIGQITNVWMTGKRETAMCYYQSKGIRTDKDMYIRYATGKELYYILPDERTNYIEDKKYEDRINQLRILLPNQFIDISNFGKYRKSNLLYEWLKYVPEDEINW